MQDTTKNYEYTVYKDMWFSNNDDYSSPLQAGYLSITYKYYYEEKPEKQEKQEKQENIIYVYKIETTNTIGYLNDSEIVLTNFNVFNENKRTVNIVNINDAWDGELILYPMNSKSKENVIKTFFGKMDSNNDSIEINVKHKWSKVLITDNDQQSEIVISDYAFHNNQIVECVDSTNSSKLVAIGNNAFSNCDKLKFLNLKECSRLNSIGDYAFNNCTLLIGTPSVQYTQNMDETTDDNNVIFNVIQLTECSRLKNIGNNAFYNCNNVKVVDLKECSRLENIGNYAFGNCNDLTHLVLSECFSLKTLGTNVCNENVSVIVPEVLLQGYWENDVWKINNPFSLDSKVFTNKPLSDNTNLLPYVDPSVQISE